MNPFTRSARILASGTALTLALVACGGAGTPSPSTSAPSSATAPAPSPSAPAAQRVSLADFTIEPEALVAESSTVAFEVSNDGLTPHNLTVRTAAEDIVARTPDLRRQESASLVAELAPGEYILFCSLAGHESLGMRSSLIVETP
jgi:uncharacterized cupredoxin-like copper-binding protein